MGHFRIAYRLSPAISWAVTYVRSTDEGFAIALVIRAGICGSVSDGPFEDYYGTAA
jgi:hypothetical protein